MDLLQQLAIIEAKITRMEQIFRLNSVIERISPPRNRHEALTIRALEAIRNGLPETPRLPVGCRAHNNSGDPRMPGVERPGGPRVCRHVGVAAPSTLR